MEELELYKISVLGVWYAIVDSERDEYRARIAKSTEPLRRRLKKVSCSTLGLHIRRLFT
jgi:hypothetical protein